MILVLLASRVAYGNGGLRGIQLFFSLSIVENVFTVRDAISINRYFHVPIKYLTIYFNYLHITVTVVQYVHAVAIWMFVYRCCFYPLL